MGRDHSVHVPREERPTHSLLAELPLPAAVPTGVTFVLGTQRLDLAHLKPVVQEQAGKSGRLVTMRPLSRDAVARMADALSLDPAVSRQRLNELSHGHPLATRYLIQALLRADEPARAHLLDGGMAFDGDIESVYASAWREIADDPDAMHVLGFIARAEAPMPLKLLATIVEEQAIERALLTARHLLRETVHGWSVFHNSFRLYVVSKPRMRLGSVDIDYSQRVYRELAQLARDAPADSQQRWLELRYRARAGVLALRHVAGELRSAGLLSRRDMPSILERLNAPLPPLPLMRAQVRPHGIRRPLAVKGARWGEAEQLWAEQVGDDVAPWSDRGDERVVAEVSRFKVVEARRAEYRLHRIRAPRLRADDDDFWKWYHELPAAVWLGQVVPLDGELAPTLVRRLVSSFGMDAPAYPITLCPNWLRRLQWQRHEDDSSIYVDSTGVVVARLMWWRDAGPVDIDDDSLWGEGSCMTLTTAGLRQSKAVQGDLTIHSFARREAQRPREDGATIVKTAQHSYSTAG